jgi:hypothetical protein
MTTLLRIAVLTAALLATGIASAPALSQPPGQADRAVSG